VTRPVSPRQVFAGYLACMLLMQAAWILTTPAFRGPDEFDHVYKAAAVARGQWTAPHGAPHGRGGIVTIPGSIVRAASPVCQYYDYVGHDNCFPIKEVGHGHVQVATSAGAYNPAYYVVVGTLARPFTGAGVDFAMRAVTALLCSLLLAWAAVVVARWSTTVWPLLAFTVGLTPALVYSTAIAAPNGLTYASAALVWAALIGLTRTRALGRHLVLPLTVGSVTLVVTHTTGSMWLLLTGLVVLVLQPLREWARLIWSRWRTWLGAAAIVLTVTALSSAWIRLEHTNNLGTKALESDPFPFKQLPVFQALWALQSIGTFPLRNEQAPVPVYVIWGVLLICTLTLLFWAGSRRERIAGAMTLALLLVVPTALSVVSYRTESLAWQGRYSLPLWLGITFLAGLALDRRRNSPSPRATVIVLGLVATAMTISTVHVGLREISQGPADPVAAAFPGGMVLVAVLTVLGALAPLTVLLRRPEVALAAEANAPATVGS
jgi:hypothetical protein